MESASKSTDLIRATDQPLAPDVASAFQRLLDTGTPKNTREALAKDIRYIEAWYRLRFEREPTLPYSAEILVTFITDHVEQTDDQGHSSYGLPSEVERKLLNAGIKAVPGPHRPRTIQRRVATLSKIHAVRDLENPTRHPAVREALRSMRRTAILQGSDDAAYAPGAATREVVDRLLDVCGEDLRGLRDRALIAVGFASGGRRPSELARIELKHITSHPDGSFTYLLPYSKRRKHAKHKPVRGAAAAHLSHWLDALRAEGVESGMVFRGVRNDGTLNDSISARTITRIVAARAAQAALPGDWSAKSLRRGFLTQCADAGVSIHDAIELSDHATLQGAAPYFAAKDALKNKAGGLL